MSKRVLAWSTVALTAVLALILAFPHSRFWLHGRVRGEAFYRGKATFFQRRTSNGSRTEVCWRLQRRLDRLPRSRRGPIEELTAG
jgi:hypothetical protein